MGTILLGFVIFIFTLIFPLIYIIRSFAKKKEGSETDVTFSTLKITAIIICVILAVLFIIVMEMPKIGG
jgi:hypothetical protein